jgi:hypothetical protein
LQGNIADTSLKYPAAAEEKSVQAAVGTDISALCWHHARLHVYQLLGMARGAAADCSRAGWTDTAAYRSQAQCCTITKAHRAAETNVLNTELRLAVCTCKSNTSSCCSSTASTIRSMTNVPQPSKASYLMHGNHGHHNSWLTVK